MTERSPIPACLSHLTQRDSDVSKPKPYRNTPTHNVWRGMLNRCRNPSHPNWKSYGGRGITVCERWKVFSNFLKDMGERPNGMQIDRRDNDGGYTPENCVWVTRLQQAQNRRNNLAVFVDGEKMSANEATRRYNIPSTAIYRMRKTRKMTPTEAVLYYKKNRQTGIGRSFLTPAKLTSDEALAVRARALEEAAQIADRFTCGGCGMDGKIGIAIRAMMQVPTKVTVVRRDIPTPPAPAPDEAPIDMILHCPKCGMLHEDMPSGDWANPPHKSHLCRVEDGGCGTIWRPADVATNGVRKIKSKSQHDTWEVADHVALAPDDAAIRAELIAALRAMEAGR